MALEVIIKVVPSSGRNAWAFDKNGTLKCFLKSPPEKGQANKELIKSLSKRLKVPQHEITIVSGATIRMKRLSINVDFSYEQMLEKLGIQKPDVQESLW